jgi:Na+-transporting NADH:ubiquinone oxidoreductase subunit C
MSNERTGKVLLVATALCIVCSVLVSTAALGLRPLQEANSVKEIKRNILSAAGLLPESGSYDLDQLFSEMETLVVVLKTGERAEGIDPQTFDPAQAEKVAATTFAVPEEKLAKVGIRSHATMAKLYLKRGADGAVETVVLPIHGKGLWSTMYAFLSLESDLKTVKNLIFYKHAETPGLGGEVDNPLWKAQWPGKRLWDDQGSYRFKILKGRVQPNTPNAQHLADGLSGATITTNGVNGTIEYWMGPEGFGPFLQKLREQGARRG